MSQFLREPSPTPRGRAGVGVIPGAGPAEALGVGGGVVYLTSTQTILFFAKTLEAA